MRSRGDKLNETGEYKYNWRRFSDLRLAVVLLDGTAILFTYGKTRVFRHPG